MSILKTVLFCFFVTAANIYSQEPTTITIRKGDATSVALRTLAGSEGAAATKVLLNDLEISGALRVGAVGQASFTISGTVEGGRLKGVVTDGQGAAVLERTYTGSDIRQRVHLFADDIVQTLTGQKGIAASKIAFVANRTGRKEIYLADYDGANIQQLTKDGSISVAPALSPDGRRLAYTGYLSGYADIYLVDLVTGSRNRLVKFPGTNSGAAFSPDGGRIACTVSRDGNPELYVVSLGGTARRLTRTRGVESSPSWSPNGAEIIYSSDDRGSPQLFRISASGGIGTLVTTGFSYSTEPNWSPDGKKVAFTARTGGAFSIGVKNLESGSTQLVASGGEDPVWGANSRHLIYSAGAALVLLDTQTGRQVRIITNLGKVSEPTWTR